MQQSPLFALLKYKANNKLPSLSSLNHSKYKSLCFVSCPVKSKWKEPNQNLDWHEPHAYAWESLYQNSTSDLLKLIIFLTHKNSIEFSRRFIVKQSDIFWEYGKSTFFFIGVIIFLLKKKKKNWFRKMIYFAKRQRHVVSFFFVL